MGVCHGLSVTSSSSYVEILSPSLSELTLLGDMAIKEVTECNEVIRGGPQPLQLASVQVHRRDAGGSLPDPAAKWPSQRESASPWVSQGEKSCLLCAAVKGAIAGCLK